MTHDFSPPPIHDFPDRGIKWLLEFIPNLVGLMTLITPELVRRIDFDRAELERQPLLTFVEKNIPDQNHREEVTKMVLTAAEFIRQETRQLTQRSERQAILIKQMEIKFGSLPTRIPQAIESIEDTEKLMSLLSHFPTVSNLSEMESLLNGASES